MGVKSTVLVCMLLLAASGSAAAQGAPASEQFPPASGSERTAGITDREPGRTMLPYEMTRATEKLVSVTRDERRRFEAERDKGRFKILKLFAAPKCAAEKHVVDVSSGDCTAAIDFIRASFYSFRHELYGETFMDVRVLEGSLIAGNGGMVHGMIVDLGGVDASVYDSNHPEVRRLADFPVAETLEDEGRQRGTIVEGLPIGDRAARTSVTLKEGNTYLVRIVAYGFKRDDRADFFRGVNRRVFQRDQVYVLKFGGINKERVGIFLWKRVSDRPSPKL